MMTYLQKYLLLSFAIIAMLLLSGQSQVQALEQVPMGIHILTPEELVSARELTRVSETDERWTYVTIPFTLNDVGQHERWQAFFDEAKAQRVIPLVRLATRVEDSHWMVPNYHDIVSQISFLSSLNWPTDQKHIMVFNEVNHAKEWGGRIDPAEYTRIFMFTSQWAHSEQKNYVVLPAAMDLAAPNGSETKEAFAYLDEMHATDKSVFDHVDAWNSHSYPNPGFASSPQRTQKNSLRGFEHELAYLKGKTDTDFKVYITETGWEVDYGLQRWLPSYYTYALQHVWSHPQVVAVTPFLLKGTPGPFAGFSFLTEDNQPTPQYQAYRQAISKVYEELDAAQLSQTQ